MEDNPYQAPGFSEKREIAFTPLSDAEIEAFVGRVVTIFVLLIILVATIEIVTE